MFVCRKKRFATQAEAVAYAETIYQRFGIIAAVEVAKRRTRMKPTITKITGHALPKGWCYIAHFSDGSTMTLRAHSTRRYENAFQHATGGRNGAGKDVLAGFFTWGIRPERNTSPIATFKIEYVA